MATEASIVLTCSSGMLLLTFSDSCESFGCWTVSPGFLVLPGLRSAGLCFVSRGPETTEEGPHPVHPLVTSRSTIGRDATAIYDPPLEVSLDPSLGSPQVAFGPLWSSAPL